MSIIERIFHRKELIRLRKENKELLELNEKISGGDCTNLTSFEKKMILDALIDPCYFSKVHNPKTKYFIRQVWRVLKEKIKMFEALENQL